ncbi:Hcp family type VI secretion system effector [Photorhabdus luminescens]|uniref:Type VI secretion system tube protein Hcp n=1 Tax=Photorhabdus luminescens subsp. mexicana TaxID=2100167 RepID=A0A4R4JNJ7_PHOLU|nr:Hcp family type VI secretion system effector [Photorhabdus luminescens]TDB55572.1 type VI secretion system tube protein Hcp [Photorhabdus luminescens subsp. mexicana]
MANIIYLTLKGKKQGLISAGCGSLNSIGNNYQHGHENEIFIYSLQHLMTREQHVSHHPVMVIKPVDKSSPLLTRSFDENEELECLFENYRTSLTGGLEKNYSIRLGHAFISSIKCNFPHSRDNNAGVPQEIICFTYKNITWNNLACSTGSYSFWDDRVY